MVIVLLHVIMSVHDPMMWMIVEFLGRGQSVCDYDRDNVTFGLTAAIVSQKWCLAQYVFMFNVII